MMSAKQTCTIMQYTDGNRSKYITMHGTMSGQYFNSAKAEIVAEWTWYSELGEFNYAAATRSCATKEAPAVYWQR